MTRLIDYFAVVGCQCDGEATVGLVFSYLRFTVQFNCSKHPLPQWYKYVINLPMDNPAFDHVCLLIFQEIFPVPERSFSVFLKSIGKTVHLHLASSWLVWHFVDNKLAFLGVYILGLYLLFQMCHDAISRVCYAGCYNARCNSIVQISSDLTLLMRACCSFVNRLDGRFSTTARSRHFSWLYWRTLTPRDIFARALHSANSIHQI